MHDIRYDAVHDEIFVTNPFAQAVLTFPGSASGEEPPIRIIQGPHTELQTPDVIEVDPVHNEIFVPDWGGMIHVYRRDAQGDTAPLRTLRTGRGAGGRVVVDPVHNLLIASGSVTVEGKRQEAILIFNRTDEGDAKPRAVISGPKTGLIAASPYQIDAERGWIVVAQATLSYEPEIYFDESKDIGFVGIWSINDKGDVPPRWRIDKGLRKPRGVSIDPKHKELSVVDMHHNAVLTYSLPEMFETQKGN